MTRLGFLGVGWIGLNRMRAIGASGHADIAVIADPSPENLTVARQHAPDAVVVDSLDALLQHDLDGVVIATPSALHAEQSIAALEKGCAVFCQKPLGRTREETQRVVSAAHRSDRLLGVDLSYRHTAGMRAIHDLLQTNVIGQVYAVDLVFHNAYGPNKAWFYDPALSGGGCVIDLGIHLIDLMLWCLDFPQVQEVSSRLFAKGQPLKISQGVVEDYATTRLDLSTGAVVQLACSWNLPAGCEAVIGATFYGTQGGLAFRNSDGGFYNFTAERFYGTQREALTLSPDAWGGRAAVSWTRQLAEQGPQFDTSAERLVNVAAVIDRIYGRG